MDIDDSYNKTHSLYKGNRLTSKGSKVKAIFKQILWFIFVSDTYLILEIKIIENELTIN